MQGGYPAGSYPPDPNTPQPPPPDQQQQMAPQQGPTLGDANMPPGNPYLEQFLQMHQALSQQAQALKEPLQPPTPGPSLLESLGTFGIANLKHIADENTRREQNYVRHQHNLAIDQHTNDMALKATDAQATAAGLMGRANLAQMMGQLRILEFQNKLQDQAHRYGQDAIKNQLPMPNTPEGMDMATARGMEPDPEHPRYMRLRKNAQTGAWEGAAPGSAVDTTMKQIGGGGTAPSSQPNAGESPQDFARRKTREAKPLGKQQQTDVTSIDESIAAAKEISQLATDPEVQKWMGPLRGRGAQKVYDLGGQVGNIELPSKVTNYLQKIAFLQAQATGPLLHGSRNMMVWKQIQTHLPKPYDTPRLANDKLKGLTDLYSKNRDVLLEDADLTRGSGADTATTETPTSTTPPSTGAPTQPTGATGVTPSGIRFRVIQ